jgi:hypothetical protein
MREDLPSNPTFQPLAMKKQNKETTNNLKIAPNMYRLPETFCASSKKNRKNPFLSWRHAKQWLF